VCAGRIARLLAVALAALLSSLSAWAGAPKSIAVMDFELLDDTRQYNTPAVNDAQDQRLRLITEHLKREFSERDLYQVLDTSAVSDRIEAVLSTGTFYGCNGCELDIAKTMNADLVSIGWVQKVSNLILNINIEVKDTRTGQVVYGKSVDLRGNTDTSWLRGVRYLVDSIVEKKQHLRQ
jgi:hypothetical protein